MWYAEKKKKILITQRVIVDKNTKERRDCLDQRWIKFFNLCNIVPIVIPNVIKFSEYLKQIDFDGVVLSGGNCLYKYGGDAKERDLLEKEILKYCIVENIPIIGVCRGMQVIQDYFKIKLVKVYDQVLENQKIIYKRRFINVNSFHEYGTFQNIDEFKVLAYSEEKLIKSIIHNNLPIMGLMWHPERYKKFKKIDIDLFVKMFQVK